MKVSVEEHARIPGIEVRILCPSVDDRVRAILAAVNACDQKLAGNIDGKTLIIPIGEVLYIETVDNHTFLYTEDAVLESHLRLYEAEEALADTEFIRATKSLIVNFDHVHALRPFSNARLELILTNGEHLIASRRYAPAIKQKIGL